MGFASNSVSWHYPQISATHGWPTSAGAFTVCHYPYPEDSCLREKKKMYLNAAALERNLKFYPESFLKHLFSV